MRQNNKAHAYFSVQKQQAAHAHSLPALQLCNLRQQARNQPYVGLPADSWRRRDQRAAHACSRPPELRSLPTPAPCSCSATRLGMRAKPSCPPSTSAHLCMLRRQLAQVQPIRQAQPQHDGIQQLIIAALSRQPAARHLRPLQLGITSVLLHPLAVRVEALGPAEAAALRAWMGA